MSSESLWGRLNPAAGLSPPHKYAVLLACALLPIACQKKAAGPPPRYAIVRFENLSGDPSLEWLARGSSETLVVSLTGAMDGPVLPAAALARTVQVLGPRPAGTPGSSAERERALLAGASRLISGYIERFNNQIRIIATEEDLSSGKSLKIVSGSDASPTAALGQLARQFSSGPKPPPTLNPAALRLYALGSESPIDAAINDLDQATHLDPTFGAAWIALANLEIARGDRAAAEEVMNRARLQKLDPLSLARLNLDGANLRPDPAARIEALRKVVALSPEDTALLRTLTESEMATGRFASAAADWKKLTVALPNDPANWNSLGYTLSYAGDYKGALAALEQYARMLPRDANPQDSIGDLNYSFRRFREAADSYMRAHDLQPDFERYGDLYKGAWAKFMAGDKASADKLFSQFRAERENSNDGLIGLMAADWFYRTGRSNDAHAMLRKTVADGAPEQLRSNILAQLTIWELMEHDRTQAIKDAAMIGPRVTDAPMLIARFAAMPSAPAAEWESRAESLIPDSMAAYRPLALGYALLFDGKRESALPVWGKIVEASPATEFFVRAIYTRLQGKPLDHPLPPDPANFNEFSGVLDAL